MRIYIVEVDPPIALELWSGQHLGDTPHWRFSVSAYSPNDALESMSRGPCKNMPMRVVG
jgi:hypothetical protein